MIASAPAPQPAAAVDARLLDFCQTELIAAEELSALGERCRNILVRYLVARREEGQA